MVPAAWRTCKGQHHEVLPARGCPYLCCRVEGAPLGLGGGPLSPTGPFPLSSSWPICLLTAPPPPHSASLWGGALPCHHLPPLLFCLLTFILVLFALMSHSSAIPSSQWGGPHSLGPEFLNHPQSLLLKLKYSSLYSCQSPCLLWTETKISKKKWLG